MYTHVVLGCVLINVLIQVHGGCINCGLGEGKDICTGGQSCTPMVVRPVKLQKFDFAEYAKPRVVCKQIGGLPPLKPVGDLCSCRQAIVSPAIVPRPPPCTLCKGEHHSSSSSSSSSGSSAVYETISGSSSAGSSGGAETIIVSSSNPVYSTGEEYYAKSDIGNVPADAVSLSLAYKLQNDLQNVAEDKLAFGFRTLPKELTIVKKVKSIPEENLYRLNGQIVELKPAGVSRKSVDEEAIEELLNEELVEEIIDEIPAVKKLSLEEIGYGPTRIKQIPFLSVQGNGEVLTEEVSSGAVDECNDGYVPGNVIIKSIPKPQVYQTSEVILEEEDVPVPVRYPAFSYGSSSSSSSSRSSSSSSKHHNIIYEKFEYD